MDDCKIASLKSRSLSSDLANVRSGALGALRNSAVASETLSLFLAALAITTDRYCLGVGRFSDYDGHIRATASTPLRTVPANQARHDLLSNANFIIEKLDRMRDRSRAQHHYKGQ